jgi:hypothetical protein
MEFKATEFEDVDKQSSGSGWCPMAGSCEHGSEVNFLTRCRLLASEEGLGSLKLVNERGMCEVAGPVFR